MSEYREQAILDVAKATGYGAPYVRGCFEAVEEYRNVEETMLAYAVAQRERVLELEAALKELRDEHGCDCGDEAHEEGCPIKTISAALKGD